MTARSRLLVLSAAVWLPATLAARAPRAGAVAAARRRPCSTPSRSRSTTAKGYTPPTEGSGAPSPLSINGYVDVGFAKAQGDGTSFAPGDTRVPLDYGVDSSRPR